MGEVHSACSNANPNHNTNPKLLQCVHMAPRKLHSSQNTYNTRVLLLDLTYGRTMTGGSAASKSKDAPVIVNVPSSVGDHVLPRRPTSLPASLSPRDVEQGQLGRRQHPGDRQSPTSGDKVLPTTKNGSDQSGDVGDGRSRPGSSLPPSEGTSLGPFQGLEPPQVARA